MIDTGNYNLDPGKYSELVSELYNTYPSVTLPPEYTYFIEKDLIRLLIRLARYKFVARLIKRTDRILEIGSGSGLGSILLGQHCEHVTGLELKKTEIEEARSINRRKNVEFVLGDLFELDSSDLYDVVIALDVIEHMPVEKGRELVGAMVRHLKPTGMLIIGTPSIYSYEYQSDLSKASHVKCYDKDEIIPLVEELVHRSVFFSMNDELVHTGFHKMAWYYFILGFLPRTK